ncbi:MAG: hypothetical protein V2I54_05500, partial [Bacteroidales bacterium]|nr:hypothetical protein [Bacteroidales bacterium]
MIDLKKHSFYKPMEVDSIFSHVFQFYFKKFFHLFIFSFIAVFFIQLMAYHIGFFEIYSMTNNPQEMMNELSGLMGKVGLYSIGAIIIYGILNAFLIYYILNCEVNPKASPGNLFMESFKKYSVHMIFFLILSGLILVVGAMAGVFVFIIGMLLAMIYLGTVLFPGGAIVVAEEKNALEAIGRTFSLCHKDFWSTLGSMVLFILIMILISIVVSA